MGENEVYVNMIYLDRFIRLMRFDFRVPVTCWAPLKILYDPKASCNCIKTCKYPPPPSIKVKETRRKSYKYEI